MTVPSLDLFAWLSADAIQTLGWTLIHFLWQGLALALLFQAVVPFCRTAAGRYNLAFATLAAMAAAPVATFVALSGSAAVDPVQLGADIAGDVMHAVSAEDSASASPWLHWLVVVWFAGVAALSLRVAGGWYVAHSLRTRETSGLPPALRDRFARLKTQLGISRPVVFLQSALVNAPAVVGWLRPVVLIPASAVVGLSAAQLEAVIVHELAHIRRFDVLANLLQMAVETALFYHPAVWWISRRIRVEREHCCDDVAVATSGDAVGYARALASLEEWRAPVTVESTLVLAASGGVLKHRISRLLGLNIRGGNVSVMGVAGVGIICLIGCVIAQGADADAGATTPRPFPGLAASAAPGEPATP
ncbi:MAG: M56 family metallopeptidase, partial [Rhodospirillaceae bacterium]|nr:M56 family metallopeptidase [Rhodospirillaceae bacterium]